MFKKLFFPILVFALFSSAVFSQTKISGIVVDKKNQPISFASIAFKNSSEGVISNEDGRFYLESNKSYEAFFVAFDGYSSREVEITKSVMYDLKIVLNSEEVLQEVKIFRGKTSKKNNPAIDILRKIWERKRKNGLKMFNQYQY